MPAALMFALLLVVTLLLVKRNSLIAGIIGWALAVRLLLLAIHHNLFRLIPGRADVYTFYSDATYYSDFGFLGALSQFNVTHSNAYGSMLGALFSLLGPSWFIGEVGNIILSLFVIVFTYRLARNCGGSLQAARLAAFIMAINPSTAQYGVVALREMIMVFFLMLGLVALTSGREVRSVKGIIIFSLCCLAASAFHGAMIIAVGGLIVGLYAFQIWAADAGVITRKQVVSSLILLVGVVLLLAFMNGLVKELELSKVSLLNQGNYLDVVNYQVFNAAKGNSAYLTEFSASSPLQLVLLTPLRVFYFLFSPMPWDVRGVSHLLGFIDAALYIWAVAMLWRGFRRKVFTQKSLVVFGVVSVVVLGFAYGTSNAGTAIRHRAKISYALVAVACVVRERSLRDKAARRAREQARAPSLQAQPWRIGT